MQLIPRLAPLAFITLLLPAPGAPPAWWQEGDFPVVDPGAAAHNHGPANVGQAKWIAKRALETLTALDPALGAGIHDQLTLPQPDPAGQGQFLPAILDFELPADPPPADWHERQHAPLRIGQLKAIAAPFYDALHALTPSWLDQESADPATQGQLQLNGTKDPHDPANFYPWSADPSDDHNQAPATLGQLKAVFSLRFESLAPILDTDDDHDGLTFAMEAARGTDPHIPDSDGDGMNDGWEVKWGFEPDNPSDASADTDGDNLTNLRESEIGTSPTGNYRIEVLPLATNRYFHMAADDGSVVVRDSADWEPHGTLELVTAPDASGNRTIVPMSADLWNPLDLITADLVALGWLAEGVSLDPGGPESSDGTYRVFQTTAGFALLREPGTYVRMLTAEVTWQAINNQGVAAGILDRVVPATNDIPAHHECDVRVLYGYYSSIIPMPAEWFPTPETPSIQALSDDGHILIRRPVMHADENIRVETYSLKVSTGVFTLVRQPGLAGESIVALSSNNGRMLGNGPKPFLVCPDGTPIPLGELQIQTSPTAATVPLATLQPDTLIPNHISSNGRITLTTRHAANPPMILQLVPVNDADADGMADDWEKSFARMLLDLEKSPEEWGPLYSDLIAGNLNPATDYTDDGFTASVLEDLINRPAAELPQDGILRDTQGRRNILAWGMHVPASDTRQERNEGLYHYENIGWFGDAFQITSFSQLQPAFMEQQIQLNSWGTYNIGCFARFYHAEKSGYTEYGGESRQSRVRLLATALGSSVRNRIWVKKTDRTPFPAGLGLPENVAVEIVELSIPAGKLVSDWIELKPPVVDGYEYEIALHSVGLAVDANRDGEITFDGKDHTTTNQPFAFWVNDDHDIKHPVDLVGAPIPATLGQEDVFDGVKDSDDDKISFVRDLEDFTRLHLSVGSLMGLIRSGTISVDLEFADTTGSPSIKLYRAIEVDGGMRHLLDNTKGEAQLADTQHNTALGTVSATSQLRLPGDLWDASANAYLIFEGHGEGKGQLQLTVYKGTQKIGPAASVWVDLKNIRKMYQRWNANELGESGVHWDAWPLATAVPDTDSTEPATTPQSEAEKDFVLFVHGWNMPKPDKRSFAETAFKRMWQIGYKGRYGAFFWPTFYASAALENADPRNFDGSEHRAWESSGALLGLLIQLNKKYPGRVHLIAHSMGNVVAAEALHKAPEIVVKNYVASQAALPADVFKLNPDVTAQWDNVLATTFTGHGLNVPGTKAVITPNVYAYYYHNTREPVYSKQQDPKLGKPYMNGIRGASKWHNYLNPNDWALGAWIYNQSQKPNAAVFPFSILTPRDYQYKHFFALDIWGFWADEPGSANDHGLYFGTQADSPDSTYEIFCYCAQARCNPTGRQSNAGGPFANQVNFSEFQDFHPGHSAQFLYSICERWKYWHYLLKDCDIPHIRNLVETQ